MAVPLHGPRGGGRETARGQCPPVRGTEVTVVKLQHRWIFRGVISVRSVA
jgi:hypothetical protein